MKDGKCLRGSNEQLGFIEDKAKIWKELMKKIMNEENEWDHTVENGVVEGPVKNVARNEIVEVMQKVKSGKTTGLPEVSVKMIVASGEIEAKVMMELCQQLLDGRGMPDEWKTRLIVLIFKEKDHMMTCGLYRGVKLLKHATKTVERVLKR